MIKMIKNVNINNFKTNIIIKKNYINANWDFLKNNKKHIVITDSNLYSLYEPLLNTIPNLIEIIVVPAGEVNKNFEVYHSILSKLSSLNFSRNDVLISFGGGVINDLSLFVGASYQRGVNVISIPTSLLAMVDASIGGKCGVNLGEFKNQVGSFYFPKKIIIDESLLDTLPKSEFCNGISEIVKYALLKDAELFNQLMNNTFDLSETISKCIDYKLEIIGNDLFDQHNRKLLNFGHTYGHIVESHSNYNISHGNAIAIGLIKEISNKEIKEQVYNLLSRYFSLNYEIPFEYGKKCILKDKKLTSNTIDVVELEKIGKAKLVTKKVEELLNEYFW